jgi:hypothetical protein
MQLSVSNTSSDHNLAVPDFRTIPWHFCSAELTVFGYCFELGLNARKPETLDLYIHSFHPPITAWVRVSYNMSEPNGQALGVTVFIRTEYKV